MQATPKAIRLHIGIFGRRNAGKSSLLNALTRQQVSIVSAMKMAPPPIRWKNRWSCCPSVRCCLLIRQG